MLSEALVIFACINSTGCTETSNLYFHQHPDVKKLIDTNAESARQYIGPRIVDTAAPMLFVIAGGTGVVHLQKHFDLRISKDSSTLSFSIIF